RGQRRRQRSRMAAHRFGAQPVAIPTTVVEDRPAAERLHREEGMMPHVCFPNESAEYRTARNALLEAEIALRRQLEAVAAQRRALPPGGAVPEDYAFERIGANLRPEQVKLSELFCD